MSQCHDHYEFGGYPEPGPVPPALTDEAPCHDCYGPDAGRPAPQRRSRRKSRRRPGRSPGGSSPAPAGARAGSTASVTGSPVGGGGHTATGPAGGSS